MLDVDNLKVDALCKRILENHRATIRGKRREITWPKLNVTVGPAVDLSNRRILSETHKCT